MKANAKMTSKGQVTIPAVIRRRFGLEAGMQLTFSVSQDNVMVFAAAKHESPFAKYQGIGNPGIGSGPEAIDLYMAELRGHDELD